MVKITEVEKVRKMPKAVAGRYVKPGFSKVLPRGVENPCGKTCGYCGKLLVLNSYFAALPRGGGVEKSPAAFVIWGIIFEKSSVTSPENGNGFQSKSGEKVKVFGENAVKKRRTLKQPTKKL